MSAWKNSKVADHSEATSSSAVILNFYYRKKRDVVSRVKALKKLNLYQKKCRNVSNSPLSPWVGLFSF